MTPLPIHKIRWGWKDHKSALWWLLLLYRKPSEFRKTLDALPTSAQLLASFWLCLHCLIYVIPFMILSRIFIFEFLGVAKKIPTSTLVELVIFHAKWIVGGIAGGISLGIVFWFVLGISFGITGGIAVAIASGITGGISSGIAGGITGQIIVGSTFGIALGIVYGISYMISRGTAPGITSGIAGGIALGITTAIVILIDEGIANGVAGGIAFGTTFIISILRIYYYPVHPIFLWSKSKVQARFYHYHPVAWDNLCSVRFPGLYKLLISYAEYDPQAGAKEIERLIDHYPSQRIEALYARIILLARQAARVDDLNDLDHIAAQLPEGEKGVLAQTQRLSQTLHEISHLQTRLDDSRRPVLREANAQLLRSEINNFQNKIVGFSEPFNSEFCKAAAQWQKIAEQQLQQVQAILSKEPIHQVFRAGDPVDRQQEAFVYRAGLIDDIEKQITLSTGCPGLLLYGRRRVGKSTILKNLKGFLDPSVIPVLISMQHPDAFTSLAHFIRYIKDALRAEVCPDKPQEGSGDDLPCLLCTLAKCNTRLKEQGRRVLLALDEYENIDKKIGEKVFPEDLLATIRESIQNHRNLTWIFAGSREITELEHAKWTSYLVSVRTVEVPLFTLEETHLLLTEPLKQSSLWSKDSTDRPRFNAAFWGEGGIERIYQETAGWPHLVQLVAETIIDLINDENKTEVDDDLFEQALNRAIIIGHIVFYELLHVESRLAGEWEYLLAFGNQNGQPLPKDQEIYHSLRRRLLITENNGQCHLRVPLMERWLNQRGHL